ncbi:MAG: penicillin-binding transpeptidase domain-containing protein [Verrucomicrobiota bacterium]
MGRFLNKYVLASCTVLIGAFVIIVTVGNQQLQAQDDSPIFRTNDPVQPNPAPPTQPGIRPRPIDPNAPLQPGAPAEGEGNPQRNPQNPPRNPLQPGIPTYPEPDPNEPAQPMPANPPAQPNPNSPLQPGIPQTDPNAPQPATPAPEQPQPQPTLPSNLPQPTVPNYPMPNPQQPQQVPVEALPESTGAAPPPEERQHAPPLPEVVPPPDELPEAPKTTGPGFEATLLTVKGARILTLSIPAPRGQIVDRWGKPLALNEVAYYLGVNFPFMEDSEDAEIISYAKEKVAKANELLGAEWSLQDDKILAHYKDRRWLPLIFTGRPLTDEQVQSMEEVDEAGLILHPTYQRVYPEGKTASHIIGYVGKRGPWPKGEVPDGEMMWPTAEGVRGLELWYDQYLTGSPGRVQIIFNEKGERVQETVIRSPVPGHNVVTSLDIDMQLMAERHLEDKAKRGALVIMDVRSGDVLAMASYPWFDPNEYIPRITTERHRSLVNDPAKPMYGRAFQAAYPPASTFKIPSALGMLEAGSVNELTLYNCPTAFVIGNHTAHNWNDEPEGMMNVIGAITRSCNTWFYQAAIDTGSAHITMMGQKLGLGEKTGVPLPEETRGIMPTNEYYRKNFGYPIMDGDLASICIGQGAVEATPLQVCQMMAAVGNREYFTRARLVLQVQDYANGIVEAYDVDRRNLNISQYSLSVVHQGLKDVVNAGNGTAGRVRHPRISMSGKTGTGQWKPNVKQNVAWFAGFAPSEYPVYAYAALYEGDPGEKVSGGRLAGPIIGEYFKEFLDEDRLASLEATSDQIRVAQADIVVEPLEAGSIFRSTGVEEVYQPEETTRARRPGGGGGLLKSLFGGRRRP